MKNRITVSLPFSFKGETFNPKCTIDLDEHMQTFESLPCLYTHIANENGIDIYSYEHDVMMMAEMEFEAVEGMAAGFIQDSHFDIEGFEKEWKKRKGHKLIQEIAEQRMNIADLEDHHDLKAALLDAYEAGIKDGRAEKAIHSTTDPLF